MIDIVNVTKRFGKFTALSGMNLSVGCSSIYGLVGYNGAGKTTLLKTVSGVYKPEEGEVRIGGENIFDNAKMKQRVALHLKSEKIAFKIRKNQSV